jgi:uncharacterized protein (TIGR02285 family)
MNRSAILKPCRRALALSGLLLLLIITAPAFAQEKPVVVWYLLDFPPAYIFEGPDKGKGGREILLRLLIEQTPEFAHQITKSNALRMLNAFKDSPNVCSPSLLITEDRTKIAYFSIPYSLTLPNGMIIRANRAVSVAPFLNDVGEVQLEKLLAETTFRIGVTTGRPYGDIDSVLNRHRDRLVEVVSSTHFVSTLRKLADQSEYDAILGYPEELAYQVRIGAVPAEFQFLPIAENRRLLPSHVACSKSQEGIRLIARFNQILARPEIQAEAETAYLPWLPDDRLRAYYWQRKAEPK